MNEINIEWQQRTELLLGKDKMKRLPLLSLQEAFPPDDLFPF